MPGTDVFGSALSICPLIDRLTHRPQIVQFSGDSYRFRRSLERQQEPSQVCRDSIGDLAETGSEVATQVV